MCERRKDEKVPEPSRCVRGSVFGGGAPSAMARPAHASGGSAATAGGASGSGMSLDDLIPRTSIANDINTKLLKA